jgi:hypothetical protein
MTGIPGIGHGHGVTRFLAIKAIEAFARHFARLHHSIDEHSHSHLVGDVPRIHPELHSTRNTSEAK